MPTSIGWFFAFLLGTIVVILIALGVSKRMDQGQERYRLCLESGTPYVICTDSRTRGW